MIAIIIHVLAKFRALGIYYEISAPCSIKNLHIFGVVHSVLKSVSMLRAIVGLIIAYLRATSAFHANLYLLEYLLLHEEFSELLNVSLSHASRLAKTCLWR